MILKSVSHSEEELSWSWSYCI